MSIIDFIINAALIIIFANEGNYGSVNVDDNGALSIGKVQWHANRALSLLKKIINLDKQTAKDLLGLTLYTEIIKSSDWGKRKLTYNEAKVISKLITTSKGKSAQDEMSRADIAAYIKNGMKLGLTDERVLIYFADLENQGGAGASRRVGKAAIKTAGIPDKVTLDIFHKCAVSDSVMGNYLTRRNKVYGKCKELIIKPRNPYKEPIGEIKLGCTGEGVKFIQWELIDAGIKSVTVDGKHEELIIDGICGKITDKAIRTYQEKMKYPVNGKVTKGLISLLKK